MNVEPSGNSSRRCAASAARRSSRALPRGALEPSARGRARRRASARPGRGCSAPVRPWPACAPLRGRRARRARSRRCDRPRRRCCSEPRGPAFPAPGMLEQRSARAKSCGLERGARFGEACLGLPPAACARAPNNSARPKKRSPRGAALNDPAVAVAAWAGRVECRAGRVVAVADSCCAALLRRAAWPARRPADQTRDPARELPERAVTRRSRLGSVLGFGRILGLVGIFWLVGILGLV